MASSIYQWIDCDYETAGIQVDIEELRTDFIRLRKQRGMGQKEAAKIAGVSQTAISSFELGRYGTIHPKTLKGIYKLVHFWKGDAARIATVSFPRKQDPPSEPSSLEHPDIREIQCPNPKCQKTIIFSAGSPYPSCPFCHVALEKTCKCGSPINEDQDNFCRNCGRSVIKQGKAPHNYPLLETEPHEKQRLELYRILLHLADALPPDSLQLTALLAANKPPSLVPHTGESNT